MKDPSGKLIADTVSINPHDTVEAIFTDCATAEEYTNGDQCGCLLRLIGRGYKIVPVEVKEVEE